MTSPAVTADAVPGVAPLGVVGAARGFLRVRRWELLGTVVFWLYVAWPLLTADRGTMSFDNLSYYGPYMEYTGRALRELRFPQWNDTIFGGVVHYANVQSGVLNPIKFPFVFLDSLRAVELAASAALLVFAVGMVALAHRLRLGSPAGLVAAVVILGSGVAQVKVLQEPQLEVLAYLPWLLVAVDLALDPEVRSRRAMAAIAIVTGFLLVAGHPQMMFMAGATTVGWAVSRAWVRRTPRALRSVAGGLGLGVALAGVQLIPTVIALQGVADKGARAVSFFDAAGYVVQGKLLPGAVLGDVRTAFPENLAGTFEGSSFVGAAAVVLAVVGFVTLVRRRATRSGALVWLGTAALAVSLAVGNRSPVFRVAFDVVPFFRDGRVPARWMGVVTIVLAVLAAFGVDALVRRQVDRRTGAVTAAVAALGVLLIATTNFQTPPGDARWWWAVFGGAVFAVAVGLARVPAGRRLGAIELRAALVGLVVVAVAAELGWATAHSPLHRDSGADAVPITAGPVVRFFEAHPGRIFAQTEDRLGEPAYLLNGLRPNVNTAYDVRSLDGYDGFIQVRSGWADAMTAFVEADRFNSELTVRAQTRLPLRAELMARFGVRYAVVETGTIPADDIVTDWGEPLRTSKTLEIYENPAYEGEAFVYHATRVVPEGRNGLTLRDFGDASLRRTALVEPGGPRRSCSSSCERTPATLRRDAPEHLVTSTRGRGGLLVVSEGFDDGWRAEIDGRSAEVVRVDGAQLGVVVPDGRHTVELRYRTPGIRVGGLLTLFGLAGLGWLVGDRPRRGARRRRDRAAADRRTG